VAADGFQGGGGVFGFLGVEPVEGEVHAQQHAYVGVVVDDEDAGAGRPGAGRRLSWSGRGVIGAPAPGGARRRTDTGPHRVQSALRGVCHRSILA
jgi:hypothetical protein